MTTLSYRRIQLIHVERNEGNRKSPSEYYSTNCCRQDLPVNTKIRGYKFNQIQDIFMVSKCLLYNI